MMIKGDGMNFGELKAKLKKDFEETQGSDERIDLQSFIKENAPGCCRRKVLR